MPFFSNKYINNVISKAALILSIMTSQVGTDYLNFSKPTCPKQAHEIADILFNLDIVKAKINLSQLYQNQISAQLSGRETPFSLKGLELRLFDSQSQQIGVYSTPLEGISLEAEIVAPPFRYVPNGSTIEILAIDNFERRIPIAETKLETETLRTILIDRNGVAERMYLIEGNQYNPFGRLVKTFQVSTGRRNRWTATPLCFGHIREKDEDKFSNSYSVQLYNVIVYFDEDSEFGAWLHIGGSSTNWGSPASGGCVRMRQRDSEFLFNEWAQEGDRIIIADSSYINLGSTSRDVDYFNAEDYSGFMQIINSLRQARSSLKQGQTLTGLFPEDSIALARYQRYVTEIERCCQEWDKPEFDQEFNSTIDSLF